MSTQLEPVNSASDLRSVRARMLAIREWLEGQNEPQNVAEAYSRISEMRAWVRVTDQAAELRIQASRIECVALRKLSILGGEGRLKPGQASTARALAKMGEEEFDRFLESIQTGNAPSTLLQVYRWKVRDESAEHEFKLGMRRTQNGAPDCDVYEPSQTHDPHDLAVAIRDVIAAADSEGEPFTVQDAADRVAEAVAESVGPVAGDRRFIEGMKEVIRYSLRRESEGVADEDDGAPGDPANRRAVWWPAFVTFSVENTSQGWFRVPWRVATLAQLKSMAAYRNAQARRVADAASRLDALVETAEKLSAAHPEKVTLGELFGECEAGS